MPKSLSIILTFVTITLLWVLFRAENISEAGIYYKALFSFSEGSTTAFEPFMIVIGFGIVWFMPNSMEFSKYQKEIQQLKWWYGIVAGVLGFAALKMMAEAPVQSFVYFNF